MVGIVYFSFSSYFSELFPEIFQLQYIDTEPLHLFTYLLIFKSPYTRLVWGVYQEGRRGEREGLATHESLCAHPPWVF